MTTIRKEFHIDAKPEHVWDALRDVGALHTRLVPGFVIDTKYDGAARTVTFGNGMVAREVIVSVDDAAKRVAYSIESGNLTHHMASAQVFADGKRTRFVWQADVLPHSAAETMDPMMDAGAAAMQRALAANADG